MIQARLSSFRGGFCERFYPVRDRIMYYTYIIKSLKDRRYYTGSTKDLRKRFREHNNNKVFSTKNRGPFELIYYEACMNEHDARLREKYLKTGMGKRYINNRLKRFLSLTGFTILELMIAIGIIALLLTLALPNFMRSRERVYTDMCINNLRQIKLAKAQWALEYNKNNGDPCTAADLDHYIEDDIWNETGGSYTTGHKLVCPLISGGTVGSSYNINNVGTDPACRIKPSEHHL